MTPLSELGIADIYTVRALRPRRRVFRWFVALVIAATVLALGALGVRAVEIAAYWDAQKAIVRSCLDNGGAYAGGECMPVVITEPYSSVEPRLFGPYKVPPL